MSSGRQDKNKFPQTTDGRWTDGLSLLQNCFLGLRWYLNIKVMMLKVVIKFHAYSYNPKEDVRRMVHASQILYLIG